MQKHAKAARSVLSLHMGVYLSRVVPNLRRFLVSVSLFFRRCLGTRSAGSFGSVLFEGRMGITFKVFCEILKGDFREPLQMILFIGIPVYCIPSYTYYIYMECLGLDVCVHVCVC